mgnify:CR=1 FL=1
MKFKIPFSGRSHSYLDEEIEVIVDAVVNANPLTQGEHLISFEEKFRGFSGAEHAFALNNATAALELAAQLCQFSAGDEVIVPGHTYTSSAYPFLKKGANIVWADIDPLTRVVTVETIENCITSATKAIVVVHLYGYAADMPEIIEMAKLHDLLVIEDAAQALGVTIDGKMVGTFGDFGVYSFHSHKNLSTLGEGGILTVSSFAHAKLIPMLRHNGHCSFGFDRDDYWIPAMGNVDIPILNGSVLWPNNFCIGEVECALGAKLLERVNHMNTMKRERALHFIDSLSDFPQLWFHKVPSERHCYHLLVAKMPDNEGRDHFIRKMSDKGIQCVVQYYPLYRYDLYEKLGLHHANCPNTDAFFDSMVSFPFQHMMSDSDLKLMIETSKQVLSDMYG